MNNRHILFKLLGIFLAVLVVLSSLMRAERIKRFKSAIPEKLELRGVAIQGQEDDLYALLPSVVRSSSCGGAVFKLSKSTIEAIESEGLDFFNDATAPKDKNYVYPTWQETPVPYIWTSDGAWPGLSCINKNPNLIREITRISALPGSYYTGLGNNKIVVLPNLGLLTFAYAD